MRSSKNHFLFISAYWGREGKDFCSDLYLPFPSVFTFFTFSLPFFTFHYLFFTFFTFCLYFSLPPISVTEVAKKRRPGRPPKGGLKREVRRLRRLWGVPDVAGACRDSCGKERKLQLPPGLRCKLGEAEVFLFSVSGSHSSWAGAACSRARRR